MSLLEVEGLTKRFAGLTAVRDVGLTVEDKEFLQLAMSLKVNNYLKKPVSVPELKKKIEAVFGVLQ